MAAPRTPKPTPFKFTVDGTEYEMPTYNPELYQAQPVTLAEAAKRRARLGREGYEYDNLLANFGDMQLAIEKHLTDDAHAPAALAIARLIESSASGGYADFFTFFKAWVEHDGSEVTDEPGESSGSQAS